MAQVSESEILDVLGSVQDPDKGDDIVSLGMVSNVVNKDGNVGFIIEVDPDRGPAMEPVRKAAEKAVEALSGVLSVTAVLTTETVPAGPPPQPAADAGPSGDGARLLMPGVKSVVAIASGKGGVGKSTTATNLALALAAAGHSTGLLDADIYGPSMPMMLGIHERPVSPDGKKLLPMEKFGLKCMSIGFMIADDTPMIWRGPMVMSALEQLMGDVEWGELDMLVVDMPPGTGDAQLTMAQRVPLAGAVIVSTPQDLSLLDARKGLNMFRKVDVPVLGIIENMSYFNCPHCGERSEIFAHGGARKAAEELGVDFLGEIPLEIEIREGSDSGNPIMISAPESAHSKAYRAIADAIWGRIGGGAMDAPRIVVQ